MENNQYDTIIELLTNLKDLIKINLNLSSRSYDINELSAALAKAQSEIAIACRNSENPFFRSRYADLAQVVTVSRPALSKNGLSVTHQIDYQSDTGANILCTTLLHTSGQWIASKVKIMPAKGDIQSFGSAITYLKRYSYAALVGVVSSDEDDDGESEMSEVREEKKRGTKLNYDYKRKKEDSYESITKDQLEEIRYELAEHPEVAEDVLEGFKIESLSDIPKSKFLVTIQRIREIILARKGK